MRVRNLTVLVVLVAVGATACSSSAKTSANGTTTSSTPVASTPTAGGGSTAAPNTTGNGSSSFCDLARTYVKNLADSAALATESSDQLRSDLEGLPASLKQAQNEAPSAIKADFDTFAQAYDVWLQTLKADDYNFVQAAPEAASTIGSPKFRAALTRVEQYVTSVCKVDTSVTP